MSLEANKLIVTRYWEDLWNNKNSQVIDQITKKDVKLHFPPGQAHQPTSLEVWLETAVTAFPGVRSSVQEIIVLGDKVFCLWSFKAPNLVPILESGVTNKNGTCAGLKIFSIVAWIMDEM